MKGFLGRTMLQERLLKVGSIVATIASLLGLVAFLDSLSWISPPSDTDILWLEVTRIGQSVLAISGFALGSVIVVLAFRRSPRQRLAISFGILAIILAVPQASFLRVESVAERWHMSSLNRCLLNLRQIDAGKQEYALDEGLTNGAKITFVDIGPGAIGGSYFKKWLVCPTGTNVGTLTVVRGMTESDYVMNPIGSNAACRILPSKHFLR